MITRSVVAAPVAAFAGNIPLWRGKRARRRCASKRVIGCLVVLSRPHRAETYRERRLRATRRRPSLWRIPPLILCITARGWGRTCYGSCASQPVELVLVGAAPKRGSFADAVRRLDSNWGRLLRCARRVDRSCQNCRTPCHRCGERASVSCHREVARPG